MHLVHANILNPFAEEGIDIPAVAVAEHILVLVAGPALPFIAVRIHGNAAQIHALGPAIVAVDLVDQRIRTGKLSRFR